MDCLVVAAVVVEVVVDTLVSNFQKNCDEATQRINVPRMIFTRSSHISYIDFAVKAPIADPALFVVLHQSSFRHCALRTD